LRCGTTNQTVISRTNSRPWHCNSIW